jgi:hypothetical protein
MNINFSQIIILVLIGAVALLIFGIRYLKNKENMALIAKNADLKSADDSSIILMLGIMFVGVSIGIFTAFALSSVLRKESVGLTYLISIIFFSGLSFITCFFVANRYNKKP